MPGTADLGREEGARRVVAREARGERLRAGNEHQGRRLVIVVIGGGAAGERVNGGGCIDLLLGEAQTPKALHLLRLGHRVRLHMDGLLARGRLRLALDSRRAHAVEVGRPVLLVARLHARLGAHLAGAHGTLLGLDHVRGERNEFADEGVVVTLLLGGEDPHVRLLLPRRPQGVSACMHGKWWRSAASPLRHVQCRR